MYIHDIFNIYLLHSRVLPEVQLYIIYMDIYIIITFRRVLVGGVVGGEWGLRRFSNPRLGCAIVHILLLCYRAVPNSVYLLNYRHVPSIRSRSFADLKYVPRGNIFL